MIFEDHRIPRLVVAGVSSGAGKTTVALGLTAALKQRGRIVQTFKVGPDYVDSAYLAHVSGRPCRNLDAWMLGESGLRRSLAQGCMGADCAVIEGVMGVFDGHGLRPQEAREEGSYAFPGSTAEVARLARTPVVLVLDVRAMGETSAAIALGVKQLDPRLGLVGVILNNVPSDYRRRVVEDAIWELATLPVLGALPRIAPVEIPEVHSVLVPVAENARIDTAITDLAAAVERHCNLDLIERLMATAETLPPAVRPVQTVTAAPGVRIGVAFDDAFCGHYAENLELLEEAGAQIVPFSPLEERALPQGVDGLYFGGGFSETHAARLAQNRSLAEALRRAHAQGLPIYAECGGVPYLARALHTSDGQVHRMVGIIPVDVAVEEGTGVAGYRDLRLMSDCMLGVAGERLRGHECHRARVLVSTDRSQAAYSMHDSDGEPLGCDGWASANLMASLVQLHFGQDPQLARNLVERMRAVRGSRRTDLVPA